MATTILTPVTLWKDFETNLPFNEEIISEETRGNVIHRKLFLYGRQTEQGRVKIFAHYYQPAEAEHCPAILLLSDAGAFVDETLVSWLTDRGYAVLAPDYCGETDGHNRTEEYTVYPNDVVYANYIHAGRYLTHVDKTAKETSWYEWTALARYCARYLHEKQEITKVGALGIRTGGEILWKIAPYADLDCMTTVCAAGWLAYAGRSKFGGERNEVFDEERHRFIAGIDSQSYAPYCQCPALLLNAVNDRVYNCDRAYDTFRAVNPAVEKAILFSASGNGLLGGHSLTDLFLFFDKYLKGRSVFISKPIDTVVEEDEDGNLIARGLYDEDGEIEESGVFFTEGVLDYRSCDWTRIVATEEEEGEHIFPLDVYAHNERVLVYSFVRYSNGFSVTSKIQEVKLKKRYRNMSERRRVIFGNGESTYCFNAYRNPGRVVADCFLTKERQAVKLASGYGGIMGITCDLGLVTHRVGEPRFRAEEGVSFQLDVYAAEDCKYNIRFAVATDSGACVYSFKGFVEGGGKWKRVVLDADDFKSETGASLPDFTRVSALILQGEGVLFNNLIWL